MNTLILKHDKSPTQHLHSLRKKKTKENNENGAKTAEKIRAVRYYRLIRRSPTSDRTVSVNGEELRQFFWLAAVPVSG
ncbi:hypothetical protein Y032_0002g790 [Ancylostoma ceylanicum]|uniref:Uncharacterized protein n=1 Tax=Ancylostoma ceylanicum TaxID=53326 RepID=A0A016W195_9BILA|nr:hypothetical protein Y032_0002g790 [Ancylostoma ceylanicum]